MELLEGPLESLTGDWVIKPLADQGCKLSLELNFEMKQGLIMQMVARFFGETANRLVEAVSAEAARRYQPLL
jgi:ribosome-associated toxin RatA of RatAB toxin-antitoxin module